MNKLEFSNDLIEKANSIGAEISQKQTEQFYKYMELLLEWNEKMNLTAITDPEEVILKHFIDSLTIIPYLKEFKGDIFCLFDIHIGGLQIYKNLLKNGLSIRNTRFVIPNDIEQRLKKSRRETRKSEINKLNNFLNISKQIDQLIGLMHYYQATIEQESYRAQ